MKTLFLFILLILACASIRASTIIYNVTNFNGSMVTNSQVRVTPVGNVAANGTALARGFPIPVTIINGFGTNVLLNGNYKLELQLPSLAYSQPVYIQVPNDTNTYFQNDPMLLISGANFFYTKIITNSGNATDTNAAHLTNSTLQTFSGPLAAQSFTGNASGMTNLNAVNLSGAVQLANGGLGVGISNLIPAGAVYTNNANIGGVLSYSVNLLTNTAYIYYNEANDVGLYTSDGGTLIPSTFSTSGNTWSGYFNVVSGTYIFVNPSGNTGDPVLCRIYTSNNVVLPADVAVQGNLNIGNPLAPSSGGTGVTSLSSLASQVGTFFAGTRATDIWNIFSTNVASYAGQIITAQNFGSGQSESLTIAQSTSAGDNTNTISIYPGLGTVGTPTRMAPNTQMTHYYLGGYLSNTNPANDAEFNLLSINPNASGVFVSFAWYGTNLSLGQQTWPGSGFTSVTNTLGQKVYLHDAHAMGIGMVPDATIAGDLPGDAIWVLNEPAGTATSPNFSICSAAAPSPLGNGNYSWIQNNSGACIVGFPIWVANIFDSRTNGWIWGLSVNTTNGNVNVSSNLYANTLSVSNGITSVGVAPVQFNTANITNTNSCDVYVMFKGTSIVWTNFTAGNSPYFTNAVAFSGPWSCKLPAGHYIQASSTMFGNWMK